MKEFLLAYPIAAVTMYAVAGLLIFMAAFWVMDRLTPGHLSKIIFEEKNTAAAVVVGATLLGIAIIIAASITG